MPVGIIRDPKMNPTEKEYGILYVPELKFNLKYFKGYESDARGMLAGALVKIKEYEVCYYPVPRLIDGIFIHGYTKETLEYNEELNKLKAPVIHAFIYKLGGIKGIIEIIKAQLEGKLKSELSPLTEHPQKEKRRIKKR